MKQITLREFSQNPSKHIKKLPIILTRYNVPVATIVPYKDTSQMVYKSKHGDIPIEVNETVPDGKILIKNKDGGLQEFDINTLATRVIETPSKYPTTIYGKPLSGKTGTCPVCHEIAPVEFATKHYMDAHGDV